MSNPFSGLFSTRGNRMGGRFKNFIHYALPLFCAIGVTFYIGYFSSFDTVIEVKVNGVFYGYVEKLELFGSQKRELEGRISESLGNDYRFSCDISYSITNTRNPVYLTESECADILWELASRDFVSAYMLYVDDKMVAANEDYEGLHSLISQIESELLVSGGDDFSRVEISNRLHIEEHICPKSFLMSLEEINTILNPLALGQVSSVITLNAVEENEGMVRVSAFTALSPGISGASELIDPNVDFGLVRQPDSETADGQDLSLNYTLIRHETVEEIILYDTLFIDDYDKFIGTDTVVSEGSDGLRIVTYEISCGADGKEIEKSEISEIIIIPVENRIIMVGAAEIPDAVPTGTFIWPCVAEKGVSSEYGPRLLDGAYDFHLGIDIPDEKGAGIFASDGGEVIWADYTPSYGNSIRIQHNDNYVTLYAHLDKMFVSVGDKVYQGQEIGHMGNTGVAYGTHLHFEVRIGNTTVNPRKYLPSLAG